MLFKSTPWIPSTNVTPPPKRHEEVVPAKVTSETTPHVRSCCTRHVDTTGHVTILSRFFVPSSARGASATRTRRTRRCPAQTRPHVPQTVTRDINLSFNLKAATILIISFSLNVLDHGRERMVKNMFHCWTQNWFSWMRPRILDIDVEFINMIHVWE